MKKYLLIIAIGIMITIAKASSMKLEFITTSIDVPLGGDIHEYLPEARVRNRYDYTFVEEGTEYYFQIGDKSIDTLDTNVLTTYNIIGYAKVVEYDIECVAQITVTIYDDNKPNIVCEEIKLNVGDSFDINNYATAIDDYNGELNIYSANVNTSLPGVQQVEIWASDSSGNEIRRTVSITIYDTVSPTLVIKEKNLYVGNDYDLYNNVASISDNVDLLTNEDIKINKKMLGNGYYLVTYVLQDKSGNMVSDKAYVMYEYTDFPSINIVDTKLKDGKFNPYDYVTAYDIEDGDITDRIMVVEENIKEGYCIYEVYDLNGNSVRECVYFDKEEKKEENPVPKKVVFPTVDEKDEVVVSTNIVTPKKDKTFLIYIVIGTVAVGFISFKIIRYFKKKNDIIKSE